MDSVILGIFVALAVWIFMKRRRSGKGRGGIFSRLFGGSSHVQPPPEIPPEKRQIPRVGKAGTITKGQIKALKKNCFETTKEWSFEEAALVLDSVTYLRAVCTQIGGKKLPSLELQNELLVFILKDKDLHDYVRNWGNNWRKTGNKDEIPGLKHNSQFKKVAEKVTKLINEPDNLNGNH